jgi:SAM-dependent methyltransferase
MRAAESWVPTKFVQRNGEWSPSRDPTQVAYGSRLISQRQVRAYVDALQAHARGALLDLGCGHVPLFGAYRDLVGSTTCVDWQSTLHPSPHLDHEADLGGALPLPDASFDTVLLTDVLEHLPYPDRLWAELSRIVRPCGSVIIGVPFLYWIHEAPHDHHRYTRHRLEMFARDHGFDVLQLESYGDAPDVLVDVAGKLLAARIPGRLVGAVQTLAARRRPRDQVLMPQGYLMVVRRAND